MKRTCAQATASRWEKQLVETAINRCCRKDITNVMQELYNYNDCWISNTSMINCQDNRLSL